MNKVEQFAICPYCGQTHIISGQQELGETELGEAATARCACAGAVRCRCLANARELVRDLCVDGWEDKGFTGPLPARAVELISLAVPYVYDGDASGVTISFGSSKVTLAAGGRTSVKIGRREQIEAKSE